MGSMNISIRDEVYKFLKSLKSKNKSFSDVILELKQKKSSKDKILELFRQERDLQGIDWKEKEKRMNKLRKSFSERIKETKEYMRK